MTRVTSRTLIFDLDGTISDPFEGISRSVNFALEALGYDTVEPEAVRPMIGPPLNEIFGHLIGDITEEQMLDLVAKYRERYATIGYAENVMYDGMAEIIETLSAADFTLGICTSKPVTYAVPIVEMFGLIEHFEFVDGGDIGILKAQQLKRLVANGIEADSAVMIGDRYIDIEAAKSNALRSVGVAWGFGDEEELHSAKPDHVLRTPTELLELFA